MPPSFHSASPSKARLTCGCYRDDVAQKMPKKKCCSDKPACKRCPLVMMKKGTLPPGYTVKKRKLVKIADLPKKQRQKIAA